MGLIKTVNEDIKIFENEIIKDERGEFLKVYDENILNIEVQIMQINLVKTKEKGTFRGFHVQNTPFSESKTFRVLDGSIQLCYIDLRPNSNGYLSSDSIILDQSNISVLIPKGYATGYLVLTDNTRVLYYSDEKFNSESEYGIKWNDSIININWKLPINTVSEKDRSWPCWEN
jgi:dTDP-4-dehydrorhamnose 3,5-epimerase